MTDHAKVLREEFLDALAEYAKAYSDDNQADPWYRSRRPQDVEATRAEVIAKFDAALLAGAEAVENAPPLCPPHYGIRDSIAKFDGCLACLRNERDELRARFESAPEEAAERDLNRESFVESINQLVRDAMLHGRGELDEPMVKDDMERLLAYYDAAHRILGRKPAPETACPVRCGCHVTPYKNGPKRCECCEEGRARP